MRTIGLIFRREFAAYFATPLAAVFLAIFLALAGGMTFFVADGIQTVAAGALRGLNDTRTPLLFAAIGFWVVGISATYVLGFHTRLGAIGIWAGLTVGLVTYMILLVIRFERLTRHETK